MQTSKPILCLDFDGVIHSYSGWKGATVIPDPPVPGALQFIVKAMEHFTVAIYSSRSGHSGGISAMRQWMGYWSVDETYGMAPDFDHGAWGNIQWPTEKPPALITLDDRAITFNGVWPSMEELKAFQPWYKRRRAIGPIMAELTPEMEEEIKRDMAAPGHVMLVDGPEAYVPADFRYTRFRDEIQTVINCHSMENGSDTPDFMLAEFLTDALMSFDRLMQKRDGWYGASHRQLKAQLEAEGEHTEAANAEIERLRASK